MLCVSRLRCSMPRAAVWPCRCDRVLARSAGVVNAVEVVHAFDGDEGLIAFRRWVLSPDTEGIASAAAGSGRGRGRGGRCAWVWQPQESGRVRTNGRVWIGC